MYEVGDANRSQEMSDDQIANIAREIITDKLKQEQADQVYIGKNVDNDWDNDGYIHDLYEQFLQTIQQDKKLKHRGDATMDVRTITFVKYLELCLETLSIRRIELKEELELRKITLPIYNSGKMIADIAEEAIRKHLEKSPTARLIGV